MIDWSKIRHFAPQEFQRPDRLRLEMIERLDRLRDACGFPFHVTSSFREPEHNERVGGVNNSSHLLGPDGQYSGVDISTSNFGGAGLYQFVRYAISLGFTRIGLYGRHVHLDIEDRLPQRVIWVGKD